MKLFKLLVSSLILAVMWLFIYQNIPAFKTSLTFTMDPYVREKISWSHPLYTLLLIVGSVGFVAGISLMLKPYFKVRRLLAQERQEKQTGKFAQPASTTEKPTDEPS